MLDTKIFKIKEPILMIVCMAEMGLGHFTVIFNSTILLVTGKLGNFPLNRPEVQKRGGEEGESKKWIKGRDSFSTNTHYSSPRSCNDWVMHNIHIRAIYTKLKKVLCT